jgi:hypothetical protein
LIPPRLQRAEGRRGVGTGQGTPPYWTILARKRLLILLEDRVMAAEQVARDHHE